MLSKESKTGGITTPDFNIYCEAIEDQRIQYQTHKPVKHIASQKYIHEFTPRYFSIEAPKMHIGLTTTFSINGVANKPNWDKT